MRTKIGEQTAKSAKRFNVHWDMNTREVWVERPAMFGSGTFQKCPAKAESAQDAMHVAHAFLFDK